MMPLQVRSGARRGQAIIVIAFAMVVTTLAVGVAVNVGMLYSERRTAQEAADAAAIAGATARYLGGDTSAMSSAARTDATRNGFTDGVGGVSLAVNIPPLSGPYVGNANYVEVIISRTVPSQILPDQLTPQGYTVRAVGGTQPAQNGYAIMALDRGNTSGALNVSANGSLAVTGGSVAVNSSHGSAAQNSGTITVAPGTEGVDVTGGASGSFPNLTTGSPPAGDPFGGFPKPDASALTLRTCTGPILLPGKYSCTVNGNVDYTMMPGEYLFLDGGINLAGNSSLTGAGVFIYIANANYPSSGGTCAQFQLSGNNGSSLSAPTSGTYQGMLLYQDPRCTGAIVIGGNGDITATGTIYAPTATVRGAGTNSVVNVSQIVAKQVDTQNADFTVTFDTGATADPTVPALVE